MRAQWVKDEESNILGKSQIKIGCILLSRTLRRSPYRVCLLCSLESAYPPSA